MVSLVAVPCRFPVLFESDKENLVRRATYADIQVLERRLNALESNIMALTEESMQFLEDVQRWRRR